MNTRSNLDEERSFRAVFVKVLIKKVKSGVNKVNVFNPKPKNKLRSVVHFACIG